MSFTVEEELKKINNDLLIMEECLLKNITSIDLFERWIEGKPIPSDFDPVNFLITAYYHDEWFDFLRSGIEGRLKGPFKKKFYKGVKKETKLQLNFLFKLNEIIVSRFQIIMTYWETVKTKPDVILSHPATGDIDFTIKGNYKARKTKWA
jgi:hypothetical protein